MKLYICTISFVEHDVAQITWDGKQEVVKFVVPKGSLRIMNSKRPILNVQCWKEVSLKQCFKDIKKSVAERLIKEIERIS